jgi:hypothetical protein
MHIARRLFVFFVTVLCLSGNASSQSPIVIDTKGTGFHFTDPSKGKPR